MENSIIPALEMADSISKCQHQVLLVAQETTGSESVVYVDTADVLALRTITNLLAGLHRCNLGYDWDLNAGHLEDLDNLIMTLSKFVSIIQTLENSSAQLTKAKVFLQTAIDVYQSSPLLTDYNRWDVENRLFVLSQEDLADEGF